MKFERDERAAARTGPMVRKAYRYQVQGPNAMKTMEKVLGKTPPDLKFFNMTTMTIAGRKVRALRHGMAGQPGFELFGPWEDGEAVKAAIVEAGKEFGLRLVGARAYSSNTLESGWIPSPMPAIYSGEKMKPYRQWLPANCYEAIASLGGSFYSDNIEDYYLTPYDLGYGPIVKFDHDFIGREALEKMADKPHRKKVTLALDSNEVTHAINTMFNKKDRAKYFDFPSAVYATLPYDKVMSDGKTIGISTWCGYSSNEGRMLTLAILERGICRAGHRSDVRLGRRRRRIGQADGRAARANEDSRGRESRTLFRSGAHAICRRLAHGAKSDGSRATKVTRNRTPAGFVS